MREVAKALGDDLSGYDTALACENQYRTTIANKAALIVVDDVWSKSDIEPLLAESPRSRFLFTTRDASIGRFVGAHEHRADLLDVAQSRELLASWANLPVAELPATADEVIAECGRLPLALSVVGAMLRGESAEFWRDTLDLLRKVDLSAIQEQLPEGQQSFFKAVEVSFQSLKPEMQERYKALAVLLEDMAAPLPILQTLWNVSEAGGAAHQPAFRGPVAGATRRRRREHPPARPATGLRARAVPGQGSAGADPRSGSALVECDWQRSRRSSPRRWWDGCCRTGTCPQSSSSRAKLPKVRRTPWLRPLQPALHPPGTALIRTLEATRIDVRGVAVSGDGRRAVSASADKTLKVWDVESGRELRTLEGHSDCVMAWR